jgi:probable rRNA maturation factor
VLASLDYEGFANVAQVSLTFTDDEGIKKLNRDFRDIDKETDVLSFPLTDYDSTELPIDEPETVLGDIVISLERAAVQAEEIGNTYLQEVAFLTVHSVLHLLGYDHERSPEDEEEMFRRQKEIVKTLDI